MSTSLSSQLLLLPIVTIFQLSYSVNLFEDVNINERSALFDEGKQDIKGTCPCGIHDSSNVSNNSPWIVYIVGQSKGLITHECTGSLLNHLYVLTSGTCLCYPIEGEVEKSFCNDKRIVRENLTNNSPRKYQLLMGRDRFDVVQVIVAFQGTTSYPAIGIIKLNTWVNFTATRMPICLPGALSYLDPGDEIMKANFTIGQSVWGKHLQCSTNENLPNPFHLCKSKCQKVGFTPGMNVVCQKVFNSLNQIRPNSTIEIFKGHEAIVIDSGNANKTVCYQFNPGKNGWCYVRNENSMIGFSDDSNWGYCSSNCGRDGSSNLPSAKELHLKVGNCPGKSSHQVSDPDFCIGVPHESKVLNLAWNNKDKVYKIISTSLANFSDFATSICDGIQRSPALEWKSPPGGAASKRAIIVGLLSFSVDCLKVEHPFAMFKKIVNFKNWIQEQIIDGGCGKFV